MRDVEQNGEFTFAGKNDVAKWFFGLRIAGSFSWSIEGRFDMDETRAYRSAGDILAKRPNADQQCGTRRS